VSPALAWTREVRPPNHAIQLVCLKMRPKLFLLVLAVVKFGVTVAGRVQIANWLAYNI